MTHVWVSLFFRAFFNMSGSNLCQHMACRVGEVNLHIAFMRTWRLCSKWYCQALGGEAEDQAWDYIPRHKLQNQPADIWGISFFFCSFLSVIPKEWKLTYRISIFLAFFHCRNELYRSMSRELVLRSKVCRSKSFTNKNYYWYVCEVFVRYVRYLRWKCVPEVEMNLND